MATATKLALSGSTNGRPIKITQTATAGTIIHTSGSGATNFDEVWLWAINTDSAERLLTLEWGGVSDPDDLIEHTIAYQSGAILVAQGLIIQNSLVIRGFAAAANVINIIGFVNRWTP